jgi:hypothetical protein
MALQPIFRPWPPETSSSTPYFSKPSVEVLKQIQVLQTGVSPTPNLQSEGPEYPFFVWVITFDLSSMGAPASSYATAGIDLRILSPRKPRHYVKVGIPSAGPHFLHARSLCSSVPWVINFEIKVKTACLFVEERVL